MPRLCSGSLGDPPGHERSTPLITISGGPGDTRASCPRRGPGLTSHVFSSTKAGTKMMLSEPNYRV